MRGKKTGGGSRKGKPNKFTGDLREMIQNALMAAGGAAYLEHQAAANPNAFIGLLGKTLPKDVNLNANGSLSVTMYLSTCKPSPAKTD